MPLSLTHCLSHTSFLGYFVALMSNIIPSLIEILILYYSYHSKTYIDHQAVVPSFWFRTWRPCFLIAGILYDVGMLVYCIYTEDITAVLVAVRIASSLYPVMDQFWLIKHWVPFFVQKESRRFLFFRVYIMNIIWYLLVGFPNWTGSWQERNDIFYNVHRMTFFVISSGCAVWYLIQGGVDCLFKHYLHCIRNLFIFCFFSGLILSIVGFSIGDGDGNNLQDTLNYHSAYMVIFWVTYCMIAIIIHRYLVVYEELAWKHTNPVSEEPISSPLWVLKESTARAASKEHVLSPNNNESIKTVLSASGKVHCDLDIPFSSVEMRTKDSILKETAVAAPSENHIEEDVMGTKSYTVDEEKTVVKEDGGDVEAAACGLVPQAATITSDDVMGTKPSTLKGERIVVKEDGKAAEDVEAAARGLVPQLDTARRCPAPAEMNPSVPAPLIRIGSNGVFYQTHRRFALAFDGITRRSFILRSDIVTYEILTVKLRRHELMCREMDKLFCIIYQMYIWEIAMWLAQIFLTLYLRNVNTPFPSGHHDYFCQTPLESDINSAQFVNDYVFARKR